MSQNDDMRIMMDKNKKIKTRFAPSPTGELHIGGARTALFNYLFARQHKGEFLLRIEDTDQRRYVKGSVERIQDDLRWLRLDWDGKVEMQSNRLDLYRQKAQELIDQGKAYYCFCTSERLEKMREEQKAQKIAPRYDRHCLHLPKSEIDQLLKEKTPHVIRLLVPENQKIQFMDQVFGQLSFDSNEIDDQVLVKSDGYPTYHLANVIDDHVMEISNVIRGDEWLPSTPKHILLYQAFGWDLPEFAHLPLIVDQNRQKLSKRKHGDVVWVSNYREFGYLPEALLNFLAFLGWNPGEGSTKEIYSIEELTAAFSIENIHKSPAVFDIGKLDNIDSHYLREKYTSEEVADKLLEEKYFLNLDKSFLTKIVKIYGSRAVKLSDFVEFSKYIFNLPNYNSELLIFKKSTPEATKTGLKKVQDKFDKLDEKDWDIEHLNKVLTQIVEINKLANGDVFWPVRVALSGLEASPSPAELAFVLGKEEALIRLQKAIDKFK